MRKELYNVCQPPLVELKKKAKEKGEFIDLSQAVPDYSMPNQAMEYAIELLKDHNNNNISFYTPDPGILEVRESICEKIYKINEYNTNYKNIIVTAGANQAFYSVVNTVFSENKKVMLLEPYYFNHKMTLDIFGIPVCSLKPENNSLIVSKKDIENNIKNCQAIVLVNPSNPTGIDLDREYLKFIVDIAEKNDIYIICDETYEFFSNDFVSIKSISNYKKIITITSFSKSFSLTGFRVGYIDCDERIAEQILKVQDCMVICAPRLSQLIVKYCIENCLQFVYEKREEIYNKINDLRSFKGKSLKLNSIGAFFAYISGNKKSDYLVKDILDRGVLTVPGSMFENGDSFNIRVSIGNKDINTLKKAFKIMEKI